MDPASDIPSVTAGRWIADLEGVSPDDSVRLCHRMHQELLRRAKQWTEVLCERPVGEEGLGIYLRRFWNCVEYHWRRLANEKSVRLQTVLDGLDVGDLGTTSRGNVFEELTLAQALESREPKAAAMFEADYMPVVRTAARYAGGTRAVEATDNFAAELILPRANRPPRIATFQGRTHLKSWLRTVVVNFWRNEVKTPHPEPINEETVSTFASSPTTRADQDPCRQLLSPLFTAAVGALTTEDRVLLKMLVLDKVPQLDLARSLGINSGTLTRRRQRALERIFRAIHELSLPNSRRVNECLEVVLAKDEPDLGRHMANIMAEAVASGANRESL